MSKCNSFQSLGAMTENARSSMREEGAKERGRDILIEGKGGPMKNFIILKWERFDGKQARVTHEGKFAASGKKKKNWTR